MSEPDGSRWHRRLDDLADRVTSACHGRTPEDVVDRFADVALTVVGADMAAISLVEPEQDRVRTVVNVGRLTEWEERHPDGEYYALADYPNLAGIVTGVGAWSAALGAGSDTVEPAERELMARSGRSAAAAASAVVDGRVWAEIYVARDTADAFDAQDVQMLRLLAMALGTMRSMFALASEDLSHGTDALTGLRLRPAVERALADASGELTLALFDVDGLKVMNDGFGHAAGDRLLVAAARALVDHVGALPGAVVARWGGDEFAAVVPDVPPADVVAASLEAQLRLQREIRGGWMSCGVAARSDVRSGSGWGRPVMRLADATLYRAKRERLQEPLRAWRTPAPAERLGTAAASGLPPHVRTTLEAVSSDVARLAAVVDAAGWWVSRAAPGSTSVVTLAREVRRDRRGEAADVQDVGDVYELTDLPWRAEALDGASWWVGITDRDADRGEVALLAETGLTGRLVAGTRDATGAGWLVELCADPLTAPLGDVEGDVRVLLAAAVGAGTSSGPTAGSG